MASTQNVTQTPVTTPVNTADKVTLKQNIKNKAVEIKKDALSCVDKVGSSKVTFIAAIIAAVVGFAAMAVGTVAFFASNNMLHGWLAHLNALGAVGQGVAVATIAVGAAVMITAAVAAVLVANKRRNEQAKLNQARQAIVTVDKDFVTVDYKDKDGKERTEKFVKTSQDGQSEFFAKMKDLQDQKYTIVEIPGVVTPPVRKAPEPTWTQKIKNFFHIA